MIDINSLIKKSFANFLTLLNLLFGFISIILISLSFKNNNYINLACQFIFCASIIDVFDGKVARKLGTSGDFGKEIDSLADLVTFCAAPSFLIFIYSYELINLDFKVLILISSLTLLFGGIRLARFNVHSKHSKSSYYLGLPTPANAIFICSLVLYMQNMHFFNIEDYIYTSNNYYILNILNYPLKTIFSYNEFVVLIFYILSSLLLVTKIKYPKFPQITLSLNKKNSINLISMVLFLLIVSLGLYVNKHDIVLLFFILVYILGGIFNYFISQIIKKG